MLVAQSFRKLSRVFLSARSLSSSVSGSTSYQLPWVQNSEPFADREPFLNRAIGLFLLRRTANSHGHAFSVSEFLQGVKEAVFSLADILSSPERHGSLPDVLSPDIYAGVKRSLSSMPIGSRMHLDVESIRHLQLKCVNAVLGATEPGDEHVFEWMGQRVLTSRTQLKEMDEMDSKFTFQMGREMALEAASMHMEFQLSVSFKTKEKFAILDSAGSVIEGSNQFKDCYHIWRFGSTVSWDGDRDYPFIWTVQDINNYLASRAEQTF